MWMRVASVAIIGTLALPRTLVAQADSAWTHLFDVAAGAELRIATDTNPGTLQRLLAVDDRGLTVVNTRRLPSPAARVVISLTKHRPELIIAAGAEYVENHVRIDRDGVWVASRLVMTRAQFIERVERQDVVEVRYDRSGENHTGRAALIGLAAGAGIGYLFGGVLSCGQGAVVAECHGYGRLLMLVGGGIGAAVGAIVAEHSHPSSGIIYRRP